MRYFVAGAMLAMTMPAGAQTVQQRFDAATAKLDAKDAKGALADIETLETMLGASAKPSEVNLAITRAMKAQALVALGRADDARKAVDLALAGDRLNRPGLLPLRDSARLLKANLLEAALDHAGADALYLAVAESSTVPLTRAVALMGAARTEMFVDAAGALQRIDAALALAESDDSVGKSELANVLGLKGRILLNGGRNAAARDLLIRAVNLRGGLTPRTDLGDASLRADAGIAMLRLKQNDQARRYLAFSGAGQSKVQLPPPASSGLPACGGESDLSPDDVAVVEFSITDDGRVVGPRPIFASRQGEMAYAFARAVGDWSWSPEEAAKVDLFYRITTRVELRCTNAVPRPSVMAAFEEQASAWLASQSAPLLDDGTEAEQAALLLKSLAALPATAPSPKRLAAVAQLATNSTIAEEQGVQYAAEADRLAQALGAPEPVRFNYAMRAIWALHERTKSDRVLGVRRAQALTALLARPDFRDPMVRATARVLVARAYASAKRTAEEIAALRAVTDDPALPERDPLKVAALVALANAEAAQNNLKAAAASYQRTGLSAQQCALLDSGAVEVATPFGSYPQSVLFWGFEGWTAFEYDVAADGHTRNVRAVVGYPPSVFASATTDLARTVRYRVSYRPAGDLACTAMTRRVRFTIPR
jgi:tetratricopeptide (TPR) repeat protein